MISWLNRLLQKNRSAVDHRSVRTAGTPCSLNINAELQTHMAWKSRLEAMLAHHEQQAVIDPAHVCRDDQCSLGQWLHSPQAAKYANKISYRDLRAEHADFHLAIAKVVALLQAGDDAHAREELYHGNFALSSMRVQRDLSRFGLY